MKYNSIGEQLIAKAQELDPNYKPDKFNDMSEAIDVILNKTGGEGGDVWLDITPYLSEDETSISQEGYDLVWNAFSNATENPSNKYAGILYNNYKAYLNKTIIGDKAGIVFNVIAMLATETIELVLTIYNDKSVVVSQNFGSSSPVWYNLSASSTTKISQEQYDDIKALADSNRLAGVILDGGLYPFTFRLEGTFLFSTTFIVGDTSDTMLQQIECIIKSDLSITTDLKEAAVSNKIWFDVASMGDYYLTEEQYNTLVSYAKNDLLAGINNKGFFIPLQGISDINSNKPTLTFEGWYLSLGVITITINGENRKVDFNAKGVLMSPTTSPSSQVIPSIKTDGSQENLTIGNGLVIENGALKTNNIPALPSDASTKTYVLKAVNGVLTWSE